MEALVASVSKTLQQALLLSFFGLFLLMFLSGTGRKHAGSVTDCLISEPGASLSRRYVRTIPQGIRPTVLWPHAIALVAIGVPLFAVAAVIFRRGYR
jgi:ABC-2 type transport system permease protein